MVVAISSFSSQLDRVEQRSHSAAANLIQAREDAQLDGMERRRNIRERVREFNETKDILDGSEPPESDS